MRANNDMCEMLTIKALLMEGEYLIPMYQRNYAWGEAHLSQLIQDIWDYYMLEKNYSIGLKGTLATDGDYHSYEKNYYIGTLVVHDRKDGTFETVDGQQRLTTLNIILCALRNEVDTGDVDLSWYNGVNISYEFRERSTRTLMALYKHTSDEDLDDIAIKDMYYNVRRTIESIVPKEELKGFLEYFLNKVKVTRVILPVDTDLNHYFEIMNSRGEQLEKHEILKALIMRSSSMNLHKSWLIGQIWDACADMDRYVPLNFTTKLRNIMFGEQWDDFNWDNLDNLVDQTNGIQIDARNEQFSIEDVLEQNFSGIANEEEKEGDRFESVLKFPGFLLQVLRVITKEDVALDDKRLLSTFDQYLKKDDFADVFILKMLELRFLYDRFVIRRDYKDDTVNGKMNLLTLTKQKESFSYNNTFGDIDENHRAIMIESMFHVSLPSQNYKHWLCAVLNYVNEHKDGKGLTDYLEDLAKTYMFGRFLSNGDSNDGFYYKAIFKSEEIAVSKPIKIDFPTFEEHIDFFIFNYIDYCIWHRDKNAYYDFEFTSRSSVEHFYPQHPLNGPEMEVKYLHDIGNLCLISSSKNSKLSNNPPLAKTDYYGKAKYDSLKQKLMMDVVNTNKRKASDTQQVWWNEEVKEHHEYIEDIVLSSFDELGTGH
ncbi:MAG: DUF262 domain-containing protein [Bacteroidales bacterium]|nr:DUF262 domain-containing protein [Bacteroidales bacterium]